MLFNWIISNLLFSIIKVKMNVIFREENLFMLEIFCIWFYFESKSVWILEMVYLLRNILIIYD